MRLRVLPAQLILEQAGGPRDEQPSEGFFCQEMLNKKRA